MTKLFWPINASINKIEDFFLHRVGFWSQILLNGLGFISMMRSVRIRDSAWRILSCFEKLLNFRSEGLVACIENNLWLCLCCPALSHYFCSPQTFRILLIALLVKADFVVTRLGFVPISPTPRTPKVFPRHLFVWNMSRWISCKASLDKDIMRERGLR